MKALILGSGGQLGRALMETAPTTMTVTGLARRDLDIGDPAALDGAFARHRPDIVINAAAYTAVDKAESEAEAAHRVNAAAPGLIAARTAAHGTRLVHVSTDFVFDGTGSTAYRPDDPTNPIGVYGRTKRDGERAVIAADPAALIVRTAWVYAADGANFLNTMLRLMQSRPEVRVVADQIGTPTHADSLARALWTMAIAKAAGIVHFTDAGVASWYDFAMAIAEEAAAAGLLPAPVPVVPIATADYPTPARRPAFGLLDKTEGWALTGGPARHWRQELRMAIDRRNRN